MLALLLTPFLLQAAPAAVAPTFAEVRVVDASSGRGVPLVELVTVHHVRFVTDDLGRVAIADPDLLGRAVHLSVRAHGYAVEADGFGYEGVRLTLRPGEPQVVEVQRVNVAERLCRLTGEGRWSDSRLLGHDVPRSSPTAPGRVAGQDTVQAAVHRGRVWFLWGDTARLEYPLGLFRTAGATLPWPVEEDVADGLDFEYFVDASTGFAQAMMPLTERPEGVVWIHAIASVPDDAGEARLVGHYSRRASLEEELEQGLAVLDDERAVLTVARRLPVDERWRRPSGHPIVYEEGGERFLLYGSPTPNVRVRARYEDVLDPARYEAFTCAGPDGAPILDEGGAPAWRWQAERAPTTAEDERRWVRDGLLDPRHLRFSPADSARAGRRVRLHRGTVRWNEHRSRYVLVATEIGGRVEGEGSHLGEVWYAEADEPTGPFAVAVKIVTHDRMSFYNPCHHAFLDADGGRTIHFEGTYTHLFSGVEVPTPRYEYNQILYRLDLESPALAAAR